MREGISQPRPRKKQNRGNILTISRHGGITNATDMDTINEPSMEEIPSSPHSPSRNTNNNEDLPQSPILFDSFSDNYEVPPSPPPLPSPITNRQTAVHFPFGK